MSFVPCCLLVTGDKCYRKNIEKIMLAKKKCGEQKLDTGGFKKLEH